LSVSRVFRGTLRVLAIAWDVLGVLLLLGAVAFVVWRVPREREELRLEALSNRDDGPHVFWLGDDRVKVARVRRDAATGRYHGAETVLAVPRGATVLSLPEGGFPIDPPGAVLPPEAPGAPPRRVAAISDVHGQCRTMVELLRRAGVVDGAGKWIWGGDRLVVAGDVFDKGPGVTEALWTLKRLEREARSAGGRVHYLLGNHDHLALRGESRSAGKYNDTAAALGLSYADLFGPDTELGRWVRRQDTAAAIEGTLFVHGGVSREFLGLGVSLEELNRLSRLRLQPGSGSLEDRRRAADLAARSGPLWTKAFFDLSSPIAEIRAFRGALRENAAAAETVDRALRAYGVRRIVVGHTYMREIRTMFGGRVVAICTMDGGPDIPGATDVPQMLVIEGDRLSRVGLAGPRQAL
jgi:hypothetical protein